MKNEIDVHDLIKNSIRQVEGKIYNQISSDFNSISHSNMYELKQITFENNGCSLNSGLSGITRNVEDFPVEKYLNQFKSGYFEYVFPKHHFHLNLLLKQGQSYNLHKVYDRFRYRRDETIATFSLEDSIQSKILNCLKVIDDYISSTSYYDFALEHKILGMSTSKLVYDRGEINIESNIKINLDNVDFSKNFLASNKQDYESILPVLKELHSILESCRDNVKSDEYADAEYYLDIIDVIEFSYKNIEKLHESASESQIYDVKKDLESLATLTRNASGSLSEDTMFILNADNQEDAENKIALCEDIREILCYSDKLKSPVDLLNISRNCIVVENRVSNKRISELESYDFKVMTIGEVAEIINKCARYDISDMMQVAKRYEVDLSFAALIYEKVSIVDDFFVYINSYVNKKINTYIQPLSTSDLRTTSIDELQSVSQTQYQKMIDLGEYCEESLNEIHKRANDMFDKIKNGKRIVSRF